MKKIKLFLTLIIVCSVFMIGNIQFAEAAYIGEFSMDDSSAYVTNSDSGRVAAIIGNSPRKGAVIFKFVEDGSCSGNWYKTCAYASNPNEPYYHTYIRSDNVLTYIIDVVGQ